MKGRDYLKQKTLQNEGKCSILGAVEQNKVESEMTKKKIINMHHEAEIIVIARMVEANMRIKELTPWLNAVYVTANICTFLTIGFVVMSATTAVSGGGYVEVFLLAATMAFWLKHAMLSYQVRYYTKEYQRGMHAKRALRKHTEYLLHRKKTR